MCSTITYAILIAIKLVCVVIITALSSHDADSSYEYNTNHGNILTSPINYDKNDYSKYEYKAFIDDGLLKNNDLISHNDVGSNHGKNNNDEGSGNNNDKDSNHSNEYYDEYYDEYYGDEEYYGDNDEYYDDYDEYYGDYDEYYDNIFDYDYDYSEDFDDDEDHPMDYMLHHVHRDIHRTMEDVKDINLKIDDLFNQFLIKTNKQNVQQTTLDKQNKETSDLHTTIKNNKTDKNIKTKKQKEKKKSKLKNKRLKQKKKAKKEKRKKKKLSKKSETKKIKESMREKSKMKRKFEGNKSIKQKSRGVKKLNGNSKTKKPKSKRKKKRNEKNMSEKRKQNRRRLRKKIKRNHKNRNNKSFPKKKRGARKVIKIEGVARKHTPKKVTNSCKCGVYNKKEKSLGRVINGVTTGVNEYPWMVSIQDSSSLQHFCGGSLISNRYVLTAAHCTVGTSPNDLIIVVADHHLEKENETKSKSFKVKKIKEHPNYNDKRLEIDIALIELAKEVKWTATINPICLTPSDFLFFQEVVKVMGWGVTDPKNSNVSKIIKEVDLKVVPTGACREYYKDDIFPITSNMFCAAGDNQDACQGDSGGPLVWKSEEHDKYLQVGIVSWGIGCNNKKFPGIFTKLRNFIKWVYEETKDSVYCESFVPTPTTFKKLKGKGGKIKQLNK